MDRRDFLKTAGAGITAATVMMTPRERVLAQVMEAKTRLDRMAGCSWPIRSLFKTRPRTGRGGGGAPGAAGGGRAAQAGSAAAATGRGAAATPPLTQGGRQCPPIAIGRRRPR
ncbi:MAG: twin-arginine translocation signal domain-containing protein [Acidobacteria bacterium]|nr:twin-arginine translocation signal domain-containing protein [Acidobacteriota bacterium]